jgi:hypothetical protein
MHIDHRVRRRARRAGILCVLAAVACGAPAAPPEVIRRFVPGTDSPITATSVAVAGDAWRIEPAAAGTVLLFEVPGDTCDACRLIYRARLASENLAGPAWLELWLRVPGKGEFFSKGLNQPVRGTMGWASYETPFFLQKGERGDLVKLGVHFEQATGAVMVKDVELLRAPLE